MQRRSRSFLSVLLVIAVSIGVFATSSFAVQSVTASTDDLLTNEVVPFNTLETSGAVEVRDRRGERRYRLTFGATFRLSTKSTDARSAVTDGRSTLPNISVEQVTLLPTLRLANQADFVGQTPLPFRSERLGLRVNILGDCMKRQTLGSWALLDTGKCASASLALGDGPAFDATDLLLKVEGRVWRPARLKGKLKMKFTATFADPGYGFPIASFGEGSMTVVLFGDEGGTTEVRQISFSG